MKRIRVIKYNEKPNGFLGRSDTMQSYSCDKCHDSGFVADFKASKWDSQKCAH